MNNSVITEKFILDNYYTMTCKDIAGTLGIDDSQVCRKAIAMGLSPKIHHYTEEENKWILNNFHSCSFMELADKFNEVFRSTITGKGMARHCNVELKLFRNNQKKWTTEENEFIKTHYIHMNWESIGKELNRGVDSVKTHARKLGFKKKDSGVCFTQEEDEWLIKNVLLYKYEDLAQLFTSTFGRYVSQYSLRSRCTKYLKLKSGRQGFKKGNVTHNVLPIGSESIHSSGYTYVKVGVNKWIPKQQYLWEKEYGEIPEGYMVTFLDSDRSNFNLDNLYLMNRKISGLLASNHWYTEDVDLNKAAIKWCELYLGLKEVTEGDK